MRRRVSAIEIDGAPIELCHYLPEEWGSAEAWYAARAEWAVATGEHPPLDHTSNAPDLPFDTNDL